jgi:hypothetical protein
LVSALVLGVERDRQVPTAKELATLLGLGCPRERVRRAFAEHRGGVAEDFARAVAVLDSLP